MTSFTPQSNIYLTDVPWTDNYTDILNFSNIQNQQNFFNSRIKKTFSNYVYLKKDSAIKVEGNIDDYIMYNYLFYKNPTTNKYYYCFITNMEYISENTTQIYFKTDVFQTWGFDMVYNKCFVERCHVTNDSVGANTVPEGLETGEYICAEMFKLENDPVNYCIVVGSTANLQSDAMEDDRGGNYTGVYSSVGYYWYKYNAGNQLGADIQKLANANKISAISSIFMAPTWLIADYDSSKTKGKVGTRANIANYTTVQSDIIRNIDGYSPKNNKLYTYPFCYFMITNGVGGHAIFRPELCEDNYLKINIEGVLTPSCSIHYTPLNYQNVENNFDAGISGGKLPQLNWSSDQFTNWLTQNAVNLSTPDVNMALTPFSMFSDLMTLNIGGAAQRYANSYLAIKERDKEVETHAKIPPQVSGNLNSGDIATGSVENTLHVYTMTIKAEFAKIIDDYFSMFGYQVNRVQQLEITGRPNWNYVKTINCNVSGNIPESDLNEIKNIFNNGVTCWHNIDTMYDYSQNNK